MKRIPLQTRISIIELGVERETIRIGFHTYGNEVVLGDVGPKKLVLVEICIA